MSVAVNELHRYPALPDALLRNSRVLPNRWSALPLWPKDAVIVEVGVALGDFSEAILQRCTPKKFIAIDSFDLHTLPKIWNKTPEEHFGAGRTHLDFYRDRFADRIGRGEVEVLQGDSAAMLATLPDESVDLFYVDADHGYDGVRADLEALRTKVKPDGWIIMNDYIPADTFSGGVYGVIQATNEFMTAYGWEMAYLAFAPMMYCDVGLKKTAAEVWQGGRGPLPSPAASASAPASASGAPARLEALERHAAALEAALEAAHQSTSWRITAPLRALSRAFKG